LKKSSPFTVLRALGILVGLLFVATAPMIAKDKGLTSFEGIGHLLATIPLGLAFIAYGALGKSQWAKPSPKLRLLLDLVVSVLFIAMGLYLLTAPDRAVPSRVVGSVFLFLGVGSLWVAYVTRRSSPAA
jgi:uncharacterized membrane protein HdeD (DUF308 family)